MKSIIEEAEQDLAMLGYVDRYVAKKMIKNIEQLEATNKEMYENHKDRLAKLNTLVTMANNTLSTLIENIRQGVTNETN